jgi:hypothetical protein
VGTRTINGTMKKFVVSVLAPCTVGCAPRGPEKGKLKVTQTFQGYVIIDAKRHIGSVKVKVHLVSEDTGLGCNCPP